MNGNKKCYGRRYGARSECADCPLQSYCKEARDPAIHADDASPAFKHYVLSKPIPSANRLLNAEKDRRYSRADLLEVIAFMASLDARSLALIEEKIGDPTLNLSELARRKGTSRQAMHRLVTHRLLQIPELGAIITYRKHKRKGKIDGNTGRHC